MTKSDDHARQAGDAGQLTDAELDAVLDAARDDLLRHTIRHTDRAASLQALKSAMAELTQAHVATEGYAAPDQVAPKLDTTRSATPDQAAIISVRIWCDALRRDIDQVIFSINESTKNFPRLRINVPDLAKIRDIVHALIIALSDYPVLLKEVDKSWRNLLRSFALARERLDVVNDTLNRHPDLTEKLLSSAVPAILRDIDDRARLFAKFLARVPVHASGTDLSWLQEAMPWMQDPWAVLARVIWDGDTKWPSILREQVAAHSVEIDYGVYQILRGI